MAKSPYTIEILRLYDNRKSIGECTRYREVSAVYKSGIYLANFPTIALAEAQIKIWEEMYANPVQDPPVDYSLDCGNPSCKCRAK